MKITALVAAAALATVSTAALADSANVTTQAGEVVMVEKNQFAGPGFGGLGGLGVLIPIGFVGVVAAINAGAGTN
ncbi:MAG: hypothetical protein KJP02_03140 [Octadecabacter sp.]|nr:hypothetical protein [Octadecabacter sp.]